MRYLILVLATLLMCVTNEGYTQNKNKKETTKLTRAQKKAEKENKEYINEHLLFDNKTLPMGECAIGTNTYAYVMGNKYNINDKLDILIDKMGIIIEESKFIGGISRTEQYKENRIDIGGHRFFSKNKDSKYFSNVV